MTDNSFSDIDALIAAIDRATEPDTTDEDRILVPGSPAHIHALSISNTGTHAVELTSDDETDLLGHLITHHLPRLAFHLAGVGFWVTEDNTGHLNFTAATILRWLLADVTRHDLDATPGDHSRAATILTDPRQFPVFSGTCLITGIDADTAHPQPLDSGFATWFSGKLHTVGEQRDHMMRDLLGKLGLPGTTP
jgi:hypothetical protein